MPDLTLAQERFLRRHLAIYGLILALCAASWLLPHRSHRSPVPVPPIPGPSGGPMRQTQ